MELIATCAFGLEAVVARELAALGYESQVTQPGRLLFQGEADAICRANIHLRVAERVLIRVAAMPAADFDQLFDGTKALPWEDWIPPDGSFPVGGRSHKSQLTSVPAVQRTVKKAVAERLAQKHGTTLAETGSHYAIEVALLDDVATLTIDTTGEGLHKRGYRRLTGTAPLRETLASALVLLSFWDVDRPFLDPFCGTGTIPIEAALIGRGIAPGLNRAFAAEAWPRIPAESWSAVRAAARQQILPALEQRLIGTDSDAKALTLARYHAEQAGVASDIHWQQRDFADLSSQRQFGCLICNPPYGRRSSQRRQVDELYRIFPQVLRKLPTWSHFILAASSQFERTIGQRADRRRKLYNGRIECQYYQFHGPRPGSGLVSGSDAETPGQRGIPSSEEKTAANVEASDVQDASLARRVTSNDAAPAFGGLTDAAHRQAVDFRNRLANRVRHLRRWPKRGITCYRLYERDVPEIPLVVDRYEDRLHIAEFDRPHDRTPAQHADWLDLMAKTAAEVMEVPKSHVYLKRRVRQRCSSQYEKLGSSGETIIAHEGGLRFRVNLSDYIDTGLFLDHRITRSKVRDMCGDKRVLNLFGYSGAFTVYAASGGATATTTVDLSHNYLDWARQNLELNDLGGPQHRFVRADAMRFVRDLHPDIFFDVAIVDPPTYSNSKSTQYDWDIQRDHVELLNKLARHLTSGGVIVFSSNFRKFKLVADELVNLAAHEITKQTIPEDFRNRRIHRCWLLRRE